MTNQRRYVPMCFSADETTDLGNDSGTPVADDYGSHETEFNGRFHRVQIDIRERRRTWTI